jgi:hypothetical protein
MVKLNIKASSYEFTTKNVLDNFTAEEYIIPVKDEKLRFGFLGEDPFLKLENAKYYFDSKMSMIYFLQKLSLNATLITTLSNPTLVVVVNEILKNFSSTLNLVVDKNIGQILTVNSMSADLVNWRKILETVHDFFELIGEKVLYLTTSSGLGISIVMNDVNALENPDLDIIRIEPQGPSSISIYRGIAREEVSLRGYDENEILEILWGKLQVISNVDPSISKNYSLVRD